MDMKKIVQAIDNVSTLPVEGSNDMKKFMSIITEGANPHKVSLPVQMAMQHFSEPVEQISARPSLLKQYVAEAEQEQQSKQDEQKQLIRQYSRIIAERVKMKESKTINELSKDTLSKYIPASAEDQVQRASSRSFKSGKAGDKYNTSDVNHQDNMRKRGINRAVKKLSTMESIENPKDIVSMDIPLLIRLLEYAREDAKTDMELHDVTEKLIELSNRGDVLTMHDYDAIVGEQPLIGPPEED